eukprot:TRINITY_DN2957_c0_g1_i1.p1 TRINITY_DN2957_c0_g1~~TRINITY_DN2957_c0_g1_i1.p1  ORF type:complete len:720 (+),score=246.29 TRINITY_DN2957_c0_g1_i1:30-2162(+)
MAKPKAKKDVKKKGPTSDRDKRRMDRKAARKAKKEAKNMYMRRFAEVNKERKAKEKGVEAPTPVVVENKKRKKEREEEVRVIKRSLVVLIDPNEPEREKVVTPVMVPNSQPETSLTPQVDEEPRPTVSAYVPPSLRGKMAGSPADELRNKIKAQLNKISLDNLKYVVKDIAELSKGVSLSEFYTALAKGLIGSVCDPIRLTSAFIFPYAACVKIVTAMVNDSVSAWVCAYLCDALSTFISTNDRTKAINAILFFAHLHATHVTDSTLIYSIIKMLCKSLREELSTELLVILVSVDGGILRSENQTALRDIIDYTNSKVDQIPKDQVAGGTVRGRILRDLLVEMRSSKGQKNFGVQERKMDMEAKEVTGKVVGGILVGLKIKHPIVQRVTWGQCVGGKKGMWWLDIAKGLVKEDEGSEDEREIEADVEEEEEEEGIEEEGPEEDEEEEEEEEDEEDPTPTTHKSLTELTANHRILNNPLRRSIFRCIATSDDSSDCLHQIASLGLKPDQEKDVLTVILHCMTHEKAYNIFYYNVLKNLLSTHRRWKYSFMFCLWDRWAGINDSQLRVSECVNMAITVGLLMKHGKVSVTALKGVSWGKGMNTPLLLSMKLLLVVLCLTIGSPLPELFSHISKSIDLETCRSTLRKWMHQHLLSDAPARVTFIAQFLALLLPPLAPDLDLPSPDTPKAEVTKIVGTRLQKIYDALEQVIDYD